MWNKLKIPVFSVDEFSERQQLIEKLEAENAKRDKAIEKIFSTLKESETILVSFLYFLKLILVFYYCVQWSS